MGRLFFNSMKLLRLFLLLIFSTFILLVQAQDHKKYSGHIQQSNGDPVSDASIMTLGNRLLSSSDDKGNFTITVADTIKDVTISHVGFTTLTISVGNLDKIILSPGKSSLDEVVVVGYNSQIRRKVTGAVATLKGDVIQNIPEVSFDAMLQGRIPGVNVQSASGEPGAKTNIIIRGSTNLDYANSNGGNMQPLYVIDGIIFDINNMQGSYELSNPLSVIDPNDIESIDVLKDASAAAIYGARGGNGVIIVKTRRSKSLRPQVSITGYGGVTTSPQLINVITGNAERNLKLGLLNSQLPYTDIYNGNIPLQLTDSLNKAFNGNVDWQGLLIRNQAISNYQNLNMAGSFNASNSYRFSVSHYNEQGAVKGYGVERIAPSLELTINPVRKLSAILTMQMSSEKRDHGAGVSGNPYVFSTWSFPTSLVNMSQQTQDIYSGVANRYDDNKIFTLTGSVKLTDTISKNLLVTTLFGMNNFQDKYAYFSPVELNGTMNTAYSINSNNPNWNWETYAQYNKSINKHNLGLIGGFSAYSASQYYDYAYAAGINVSNVFTIQTIPPGVNLYATSTKSVKTTQSYYGRFLYDYDSKYMFTGSFRRDASSIYSPDYRWGTFYSFSAGWMVSDEAFFEPIKKAINSFKLRASYGVTGLDPGTWYAKYQQLYSDASYWGATTGAVGGNASNSYLTGTPSTYNGTTVVTPFPYGNNFISGSSYKASNSVRWEKYPQLDLGADISFLDNHINLVVDWYQKDAKDKYLWAIPAISSSGYAYYSGNYADIRNRGWEFAINTTNMKKNAAFQWNTNFNISLNNGWITKLPNGNRDIEFGESWFRKTLTMGEPLFTYKSYQVNGTYPTTASVPTDPITGNRMTYFGTPFQAGDRKIVDQNGDYNINYDDQIPTGKTPIPKVTGGLTNTFVYKGFSLTVFTMFSYGNYLINGTLSDALNGSAAYSSWGSVAGPAGIYSSALNQFWTKEGDQTLYPKLVYPTGNNTDPWNVNNSYFLQKGGFVKLKQVTLSYNLPRSLVNKLKMRNINVYGMAYNLHTWKQSESLVDPELYDATTGSSNATYPLVLKFTLGCRIDL